MSTGRRRPRPQRATLKPNDWIPIESARTAKTRERWLKFAIAAALLVSVTLLVAWGGPPFTYRVGQRMANDVTVRVGFEREDPIKTNARRQEIEAEVPPIVLNQPEPINELMKSVQDLIEVVSKAKSAEEVPQEVRRIWKLDEPNRFDQLRNACDTDSRKNALKQYVQDAFKVLAANGVLGPETLQGDFAGVREVEVRPLLDPDEEGQIVSIDLVKPERISARDGTVAKEFAGDFVPQTQGAMIFDFVAAPLAATATLKLDAERTQLAKRLAGAAFEPVINRYAPGERLVRANEILTEEQWLLLGLEHKSYTSSLGLTSIARRITALAILIVGLFSLLAYSATTRLPGSMQGWQSLAGLCGLLLAVVLVVRLLALDPRDAELVPLALGGMIAAIAYTPGFAITVSFTLCVLASLATGADFGHFLVAMGGTTAAVLTLDEVRSRTKLIQVGAAAGAGFFALTWATGLITDQPWDLILSESLWRAGWGVMAGFIMGGSLPFLEQATGIVTGISLLELGDQRHPLLQELVRRAPGTHNHSMTVASIAEAAAKSLGADSLLVRVGAYFHDIGKMLKPHYFVENQGGMGNRHANLAPAMSTLIIIGHVKDGVELAKQHNLPQRIIDFIEQHHGTTLVEYFYREAARRGEGDPDAPPLLESSFRYPGPKPQSKETAILMIADCCESASRTLSEPTPGRLEGLVSELIDKRLRDGQFDECGLTMRELTQIRESVIKSLNAIYHGRVKYPEQKTA
jgi:putative nucleotidyltransferase with HDIG domain